MSGKTTITRSSKGLVDALFDTIDNLNAKRITPEEARAISHSARAIVGIASLEIEAHRLMIDSNNEKPLKSLVIEHHESQ